MERTPPQYWRGVKNCWPNKIRLLLRRTQSISPVSHAEIRVDVRKSVFYPQRLQRSSRRRPQQSCWHNRWCLCTRSRFHRRCMVPRKLYQDGGSISGTIEGRDEGISRKERSRGEVERAREEAEDSGGVRQQDQVYWETTKTVWYFVCLKFNSS